MKLDNIREFLASAREDTKNLYEEEWVPRYAPKLLDIADELLAAVERLQIENERLRQYPNAW